MRRSTAANRADWIAAPDYAYMERTHNDDGTKTYDVTMILGSSQTARKGRRHAALCCRTGKRGTEAQSRSRQARSGITRPTRDSDRRLSEQARARAPHPRRDAASFRLHGRRDTSSGFAHRLRTSGHPTEGLRPSQRRVACIDRDAGRVLGRHDYLSMGESVGARPATRFDRRDIRHSSTGDSIRTRTNADVRRRLASEALPDPIEELDPALLPPSHQRGRHLLRLPQDHEPDVGGRATMARGSAIRQRSTSASCRSFSGSASRRTAWTRCEPHRTLRAVAPLPSTSAVAIVPLNANPFKQTSRRLPIGLTLIQARAYQVRMDAHHAAFSSIR